MKRTPFRDSGVGISQSRSDHKRHTCSRYYLFVMNDEVHFKSAYEIWIGCKDFYSNSHDHSGHSVMPNNKKIA